MAHHKRKRPKVQRAGCLMCKGHKAWHDKERKKTKVIVREEIEAHDKQSHN